MKYTKKSLSIHTDNLWERKVAAYHLPILSIALNRDFRPVFTKVTKKYLYQSEGRYYKLSFSVVGLSVELWWHTHEPKTTRVAIG